MNQYNKRFKLFPNIATLKMPNNEQDHNHTIATPKMADSTLNDVQVEQQNLCHYASLVTEEKVAGYTRAVSILVRGWIQYYDWKAPSNFEI